MADKKLLLSLIRDRFKLLADPVRAKGQQRYMKSEMPYWGIKTPDSRKACRKLFKLNPPKSNNEYRRTILYFFNNAEKREEWYAAINYAAQFKEFICFENLDVYLEIVHISQWWDVVDATATNLIGSALKGSSQLSTILKIWIQDENLWVRRTALITQLHYKTETDFTLLQELIVTVCLEKEFFIRKAIGWALRQYSYIDAEGVERFIAEYEERLSPLSIREGLKAINRQRLKRNMPDPKT